MPEHEWTLYIVNVSKNNVTRGIKLTPSSDLRGNKIDSDKRFVRGCVFEVLISTGKTAFKI